MTKTTATCSSPSPCSSSSSSMPVVVVASSNKSKKKGLDFGTVEVFEFPVALGDNPHVSSGAPIAMEWESELHKIVSVQDFELQRRHSARDEMKLSVKDRAELLLGAGYSLDEIADATMEAETTKRLRAQTNKQSGGSSSSLLLPLKFGRNLRKLLMPRPRVSLAKSA